MYVTLPSVSYHQLLTLVPRQAVVTFKWAVEAHKQPLTWIANGTTKSCPYRV
jgi:hypothetical protein